MILSPCSARHNSAFSKGLLRLLSRCVLRKVLLLCVLGLFFSHSQAQVYQYGVVIQAPDSLRGLLEENLEIVRWRGNERIDRLQLRQLYRQTPNEIRKLLETEGYYSPIINTQMEPSGATYQIVITVDPGTPVIVEQVNLNFSGPITVLSPDERPNLVQVQQSWALPQGSRFRQADWEAAKGALLRQITRIRYPRAQIVASQATIDPEQHTAVLDIEVDSGNPVQFGEITIVGLERYGEEIIMNQRPVRPGGTYRENGLLNWQSRIQDTGYFRSVEVAADLDSGLDVVPVTVTVTENKKHHAAIGAGYSTDTGKRISLVFDDLTLFNQDWKLKSGMILEDKKRTVHGDIYFPRTEGGFSNSVGARYERSDIQGEDTRLYSVYGKTAWGRPRFEHYVTLEYFNENNRIAGWDNEKSQALPLSYGFIKRELNNRLNPTKGYAIQAQVGVAVEPVLTDKSFIRPYTKMLFLHPFGEKANLILRGEAGAVISDSTEGVPTAVLFRTGGDQSVRGYAFESLGVKRGKATIGGRYLAVASAEYQYYFYDNWGAAVFLDAGNAANNLKDLEPAYGYGIGARWRSPAGPLGIDFAYGEQEKEFRIHFSFGFTF